MKKYILSAFGFLVLAIGSISLGDIVIPLDVDMDGDGISDVVVFNSTPSCLQKSNLLKGKEIVTADEALVIRAIARYGCGVAGVPLDTAQTKKADKRIIYKEQVFNDMSECDTKEKFYLCIKERVTDQGKILGDLDEYGDFVKFISYLKEDLPNTEINNSSNVYEIISAAQKNNGYSITKNVNETK